MNNSCKFLLFCLSLMSLSIGAQIVIGGVYELPKDEQISLPKDLDLKVKDRYGDSEEFDEEFDVYVAIMNQFDGINYLKAVDLKCAKENNLNPIFKDTTSYIQVYNRLNLYQQLDSLERENEDYLKSTDCNCQHYNHKVLECISKNKDIKKFYQDRIFNVPQNNVNNALKKIIKNDPEIDHKIMIDTFRDLFEDK